MKHRKKEFTVERIWPDTGKQLHIGIVWNLLLCCCLLSGGIGVLTSEWTGQKMPVIEAVILGILTLAACLLSQKKRTRQWVTVLYWIAPWILMLILTGFHGYWTGVRAWFNMIIMHWNELHDGVVVFLAVEVSDAAIQTFTLLMVVLLTQLCWWIVSGYRLLSGIIYVMAWLVLALVSGMFRPYMGMLFLIGLSGMFLMIRSGYITVRNISFFLVTAAVVIAGAFLLSDADIASITDARQVVKDQIHTWRYGEDTLPEGDLREAAILQQSEDEMLRVQTEQQKMLYLRGFVGEIYQDGTWSELPSYIYGNENTGMMKWLAQQNFDPLMQVAEYYSLGDEQNKPESNNLQISVTDACRYYIYAPVSMESLTGVRLKQKRAARLTGAGLTGADSYEGVEVSGSRPAELTIAEDWVSDPQTDEQKQYCKAEAVYRDFVYENYTQTDAETSKLMNEIFWKDYEPESDGIYSALSQVRTVLSHTVQYVKEPETAPEGTDPIKWFLTESKQGNAVYYASTAVEALRVYGIPARYVEGYFLSAEDAVTTADEEISLTGENAHAWLEIYFDGIGWLPVDVTPGYYFDAVSLQQLVSQPDVVQKNVALNDTGYDANVVSDGSKSGQKLPEVLKRALNVAAICLGIVALIFILLTVAVAIMEILRIIVMKRWSHYEKTFTDQERISYKTKKMYHLLSLWHIDGCLGWNMEELDDRISEQIAGVAPGEYRRVCALLEKSEYGGIPLQNFEERTVDTFIEKLGQVEKNGSWKVRMHLRYDTFYYLNLYRKQRK